MSPEIRELLQRVAALIFTLKDTRPKLSADIRTEASAILKQIIKELKPRKPSGPSDN